MYANCTGTKFDDYKVWRNDRPESLNRQWSSLAGRWGTDETAGCLEASNASYAGWAVAIRNGVRTRYFKYAMDVVDTGGGVDWVGPAFGITDANNLFFVHGSGSTVSLQQVSGGNVAPRATGSYTLSSGDKIIVTVAYNAGTGKDEITVEVDDGSGPVPVIPATDITQYAYAGGHVGAVLYSIAGARALDNAKLWIDNDADGAWDADGVVFDDDFASAGLTPTFVSTAR